ncbi:hypothetical protein L484_012936 [Morus notabilis]|uniref:Uncharacterized protein n=1 Tax=Morus notabilis TaxID=981085 RepID=W9S9D7_9ROSA|nr:hypothetical protein L484_012936 [Morus notabilis]
MDLTLSLLFIFLSSILYIPTMRNPCQIQDLVTGRMTTICEYCPTTMGDLVPNWADPRIMKLGVGVGVSFDDEMDVVQR